MGRLVWSSDGDATCRTCGRPAPRCVCGGEGAAPPATPGDGTVRVGRETKGRRGKTVTVVRGLPGDRAALDDVARELKRLCGTGGTVRDGVVEIQGDQRERVATALTARGHRVKLAGG